MTTAPNGQHVPAHSMSDWSDASRIRRRNIRGHWYFPSGELLPEYAQQDPSSQINGIRAGVAIAWKDVKETVGGSSGALDDAACLTEDVVRYRARMMVDPANGRDVAAVNALQNPRNRSACSTTTQASLDATT
jgi:hypothetical protein